MKIIYTHPCDNCTMITTCRNNRTCESGFSLIELLIVMVIIGLVVGISVPKFSGSLKKASLRSQAVKIVSVLKSARVNALSQKKLISVLIDAEKGKVVQVAGRVDTLTAWEELKPISPVQEISKEIEILEDTKAVQKKNFEFYPTGASSGGSLEIVPKGSDTKTVRVGYLISLNIITGRVKLSSIVKKEK